MLKVAQALASGESLGAFAVNSRRRDPTQTTTLSRDWEREFRRRWGFIKAGVRAQVVGKDGFGLTTNAGRFAFDLDAQKVAAFGNWFDRQVDVHLLGNPNGLDFDKASERFWGNSYANMAYRRGLIGASGQVRRGGGTVSDDYVKSALGRGRHVDAMRRVYSRTYSDLRGITVEAGQQIAEVLSDGLGQGFTPDRIAAAIIDRVEKIGVTRSHLIARTEIISAYNEAELNTYEDAGIEGLGLEVEWLTAGDLRVCPDCDEASKKEWTVATARGILPLHPRCRCAWVPKIPTDRRVSLA